MLGGFLQKRNVVFFLFILVAVFVQMGAPFVVRVGHKIIQNKTGRYPGHMRVQYDKPVELQTLFKNYTGVVVHQDWVLDPKLEPSVSQGPLFIRALLHQEDSGFFYHRGFSVREIVYALKDHYWNAKKMRGASTLSQQLARSLFNVFEKSLYRKVLELRISRILEEKHSKNELLELYVNVVYMGFKQRGMVYASSKIFSRHPEKLNLQQAAFLVALLPRPGACNSYMDCRDPGILFRVARLVRLLQPTNTKLNE